MTTRSELLVLAFVAVALGATPALASQHFPVVVQAYAEMQKAPDCTLCHETDRGGENTTTRPFGRMVQRFGAVKKNDGSLITALERADDEGTDSDGDCVPDIDELRETPPTDPNSRPAKGKTCAVPVLPPILKTGCTISSHARTEFVTALYCLCLLVLVRRRSDGGIVRRNLVRKRTP